MRIDAVASRVLEISQTPWPLGITHWRKAELARYLSSNPQIEEVATYTHLDGTGKMRVLRDTKSATLIFLGFPKDLTTKEAIQFAKRMRLKPGQVNSFTVVSEAIVQEAAAWWENMSTKEQLEYLKQHPRSKMKVTPQGYKPRKERPKPKEEPEEYYLPEPDEPEAPPRRYFFNQKTRDMSTAALIAQLTLGL